MSSSLKGGEIIYNSYDNNQNQLVVLDPKALVEIMTNLIRAPPRSERKAEFMLAWNTVAELGIATQKFTDVNMGLTGALTHQSSENELWNYWTKVYVKNGIITCILPVVLRIW
jgi:hypothetical protein